MKKTGKWTELQIAAWFISCGWDVFTPIEDTNAMDLVVYDQNSKKLSSLQIKGKETGSKNQGQLNNPSNDEDTPFDFLVFYQMGKERGFIFPKSFIQCYGKTVYLLKLDAEGYSTGEPREVFKPYSFDLSATPALDKGHSFVDHFIRIRDLAAA